MMKSRLFFQLMFLSCLALDSVDAQTRRSGSGAPTQRRESPSSSPSSSSSSGTSRSSGSSAGTSSRSSDSDYSRPSRSSNQSSSSSSSGQNRSSDSDYSRPSRPQAEPTRRPSEAGTVRRQPEDRTQRTPSIPRTSDSDYSRQRQPQADPTRNPPDRRDQVGQRSSGQVRQDRQRQQQLPREGQATTIRRDVDHRTVVRRGIDQSRRSDYGTSTFHRPYGHEHVQQHHGQVHRHEPHHYIYRHRIVIVPTHYYSHLYVNARSCYYYDWIYCYTNRTNGYHLIDDYPFYVYNGSYHRYSNFDSCNYQLIDTYTRRVKKFYWGMTCRTSFDQCSFERDILNLREFSDRFSCAESYRPRGYAYFNLFNENDYSVGGYNNSTADDFYENDYRAPDVDPNLSDMPVDNGGYDDEQYQSLPSTNTSSQSAEPPQSSEPVGQAPTATTTVVEEVSPILSTMTDLGQQASSSPSRQNRQNQDTQDY